MNKLLNEIKSFRKINIENEDYFVKTMAKHSIKEDDSVLYYKFEPSNDKVIIIIPDDNFIYLGEVIADMEYDRINENQIKYKNQIFNKVGAGTQFVKEIIFGTEEEVERDCIFEDFQLNNEIISLGILTDKNVKADVYARVIDKNTIKTLK
jgi:hypothetical protein